MKSQEEFARFLNLVEKIRRDVEVRYGCPVYKESYLPKSLGFRLHKSQGRPKYVFAQIRPRERKKLCRIYSAEEWANKARVADTKDGEYPKGWYGKAEIFWDVKEVDDERYREIIGALSKICQMR